MHYNFPDFFYVQLFVDLLADAVIKKQQLKMYRYCITFPVTLDIFLAWWKALLMAGTASMRLSTAITSRTPYQTNLNLI
jgi:predicted aspartyl protease